MKVFGIDSAEKIQTAAEHNARGRRFNMGVQVGSARNGDGFGVVIGQGKGAWQRGRAVYVRGAEITQARCASLS